jgi:hypothetical protein
MITTFSEFLIEGSVGFYKHEVPTYSVKDHHDWVYNKIGGFYVCPDCGSTKKREYFGHGNLRTSKNLYVDSFGKSTSDMPDCNPKNKELNPNYKANTIRQKRSEDEVSDKPKMKSLWLAKKKEDSPTGILRKKPEDIMYYRDMVNDLNLNMRELLDLYDTETNSKNKKEMDDQIEELSGVEKDLNRLKKILLFKYQKDKEYTDLINSVRIL